MMRSLLLTVFFAMLAGSVGVGLYFVKHKVREQEARLVELNADIQRNQEAIHVLKAEWSYLNDPARLRALSEKHLSMKVVSPSQVATFNTLPGSGNGNRMLAAPVAAPSPPPGRPGAPRAPAVPSVPSVAQTQSVPGDVR